MMQVAGSRTAPGPRAAASPPRWIRCAPCHEQLGGSEHATGRGRRAHDRLRRTGRGRGRPLLIRLPVRRPRLLRLPVAGRTPRTSAVSRSTFPARARGDKPAGPYSTEGYADQVAAFLGAIGIEQAHVAGVSLGAAVGMHLAARHPGRVRSRSLHSAWDASDAYLTSVVPLWRALARSLPTVADVIIQGIFPLAFTPALYVERPEVVDALADFVRSRPAQPVDAFLAQTRRGTRARRECRAARDRRSRRSSPSARATSSAPHGSPSRSRAGSAGVSWWSSTRCRTPGCTRTPRRSPRDARLPAASAIMTPTRSRRVRVGTSAITTTCCASTLRAIASLLPTGRNRVTAVVYPTGAGIASRAGAVRAERRRAAVREDEIRAARGELVPARYLEATGT